MKTEELRGKIIKWADDKGILSKATPATQATKIMEECLELVIADLKQDQDEIKDACGDILVTLIIEAQLLGLNLDELFPKAINIDHIDTDFRFSPRSILAVATNIYGAVTEDYDRHNTVDRFIQRAYIRLMVYCQVNELNLTECLQLAYDVISKRTGKMKTTNKEYCTTMTARSLASRIIKTIGIGNFHQDHIEALIEPHIRKSSDDVDTLMEIMDKEKQKLPRISFDLELAKQGAKVVTRDGRDVEVVADDLSGEYPILAVITDAGGHKSYTTYPISGKHINRTTPSDLFILKEPETVRFDVYVRDGGEIFANIVGAYQVAGLTQCPDNMKLVKTIEVTI